MTTGSETPRIIIKIKNSESIYRILDSPIKAMELIDEAVKMLNKSVAILEDDQHNLWEQDTINPPATVYICAFDPKPKRNRRMSLFENIPEKHKQCNSYTPDKYNQAHKEFNI